MKSIVLGFLLIWSGMAWPYSPTELVEMRDLFTKVDDAEKYNVQLWALTKSATLNTPIAFGYKALYYFMNAKYVFWPNEKLNNFSKGKTRLESAIERYPLEAELRLIRYSVQYNAPAFLDYKQNLEEDKRILKQAVFKSRYKPIRGLIKGVLELYP